MTQKYLNLNEFDGRRDLGCRVRAALDALPNDYRGVREPHRFSSLPPDAVAEQAA